MSISNEILPFGSPLLGLFCLIPMYLVVYNTKTYKEAFWYMLLQTLTVHIFSSYWLANFHGFGVFTLGASAFGTCLEGGLCGIVMHMMPSRFNDKLLFEEQGGKHPSLIFARILWFTGTWVCWEWMKSTDFLAYPWGTLFMSAYRWKVFTQIADITGVWGISFLWALVSAFCGEGFMLLERLLSSQMPENLSTSYKRSGKFVLVLFVAAGIYGSYQYTMPRKISKRLETVIIQQNADPWTVQKEEVPIKVSQKLTEEKINELRDIGKNPDLVIWSEGVLRRTFPYSIDKYREDIPEEEPLSAFINRMDVPFIIGGRSYANVRERKYYNSAIFFDASGEFAGLYSKMHLVPFAEQIPYADHPLMSWFMNSVVKMKSGYTSGNQYVIFKIPLISSSRRWPMSFQYKNTEHKIISLDPYGNRNPSDADEYIHGALPENPDDFVKFSTPICFEDAFPDVCTELFRIGSEVFINITNDSWSKMKSAEYQHFIVASFLAIEFRTTLVRCANSGYSVVVGPNGKILNDLPLFKEDAMACTVPIYKRTTTIFSVFGDWLAYCLLSAITLYFAFCLYDIHLSDRIRTFIGEKTLRKETEKEAELEQIAEKTANLLEPHLNALRDTVFRLDIKKDYDNLTKNQNLSDKSIDLLTKKIIQSAEIFLEKEKTGKTGVSVKKVSAKKQPAEKTAMVKKEVKTSSTMAVKSATKGQPKTASRKAETKSVKKTDSATAKTKETKKTATKKGATKK